MFDISDAECKKRVEYIYDRYTLRSLVHPDPLEVLYRYPDVRDREIAGLIASSLAYGRVNQILKSVDRVLTPMGNSPWKFVVSGNSDEWQSIYCDFKHRFTSSTELLSVLTGIQRTLRVFGSLDQAMEYSVSKKDSFLEGLSFFVNLIKGESKNSMLPSPLRGSACKRLMLYLRWMVRVDSVDPGGWSSLKNSDLIVPIDTHMHNISRRLGFTDRKNGDMKTAVEVTNVFKVIAPEDPVKYDFALTRFGIRDDMRLEDLFNFCIEGRDFSE